MYAPPWAWLLPIIPLGGVAIFLYARLLIPLGLCIPIMIFVYMDMRWHNWGTPLNPTFKVVTNNIGQDHKKSFKPFADLQRADIIALQDANAAIRGPEVTAAVSTVSAHPGVRAVLVEHQRAWAERHGGAVVEGRDIGTVVFPHATLKVFLTASDEERAQRRARDEVAADRTGDVDAVRADLARRDALDAGRSASPLVAAEDAVPVDSTGRTIDDVVRTIVEEFRRREAVA